MEFFYGYGLNGRVSYVVFARFFAVQDLGALDDAVGGDVRVVLDRLYTTVSDSFQ